MSDKDKKGGAAAPAAATEQTPPAAAPSAMDNVLDKVMAGLGGGNPVAAPAAGVPAAATPAPAVPAAPAAKPDDKKGEQVTPAKEGSIPAAAPPADPTKTQVEKPTTVEATPSKRGARKKPQDLSPAALASEITRAATEAATRVVAGVKDKDKGEAPKEVEKLAEVYKADEDIYRHLAATDPKHKNLIQDLNKYASDFAEFKKGWIKDHPGETFNPDNEEVASWMEQNEPKVSDREFARAAGAIEGRKATSKITEAAEQENRRKEGERVVETAIAGARSAVAEVAAGAVLAAHTNPNEKFSEDLAKAVMSDPAAELAVENSLQRWSPVVEAAGAILSPGGGLIFDKDNPAHAQVAKMTMDIERQLSQMENNEDQEGRAFATRAQYFAMSPEDRENYYCVGRDAVVGLLKKLVGAEVGERLKKLRPAGAAAKPSTETPVTQAQKSGQEQPATPASTAPATPSAPTSAPSSVAVGTGGAIIVSGALPNDGPTDFYSGIIKRMVGG